PIVEHDPQQLLAGDLQATRAARHQDQVDLSLQPDLGELVTGQVTLPPPGGMTCFVNTIGLGVQFAAIGALALDRARERGLGRETFARRRPEIAAGLRIFEVDQPGPQAWKRQRLIALGFGIPAWLRLVPVDFEAGWSWWERLATAGFDAGQPAVVASTGVSMY